MSVHRNTDLNSNQVEITIPDFLPNKRTSASRRSSLGSIIDRFRSKPKPADISITKPLKISMDYPSVQPISYKNGINRSPINISPTYDNKQRRYSVDTKVIPGQGIRISNGNAAGPIRAERRNSTTMVAHLSRSLSGGQSEIQSNSSGPVSPEEFLMMLNRNRAYSDSKDLRQTAIKAAAAARHRKASIAESPTYPSNHTNISIQRPDPPYAVISPHRKLSTTVIPEHAALTDITPVEPSRTPPRIVPPGDRRRRMSAVTPPYSSTRPDMLPQPGFGRRTRRYSEPVGPLGLALSRQTLTQIDIEETMLNFPKSTICTRASTDNSQTPLNKTGHVILWKARGQHDRLYFIPDNPDCNEALELDGHNDQLINKLSKVNRCYDIMPPATSVVILSTNLKVVSALDALTLHSLRAAPLWNSNSMEFDGMLTITDFIKILLKYRETSNHIEDIKDHSIEMWRELLEDGKRPLVTVDSDQSVYDAVSLLQEERIHRLLVVDSRSDIPLYVLTYKRILEFFWQFIYRMNFPITSILQRSIGELNIGNYGNISSVTFGTKLIDALSLLVERRISSVPVLDRNNRVVNIFSKAHLINLAVHDSFHGLNMTVGDVITLEEMCYSIEGVYGCQRSEKLYEVIEKFIKSKAHRLFVIDELQRLEGVISLSDVVQFLVLQTDLSSDEETEDHWDGVAGELIVE